MAVANIAQLFYDKGYKVLMVDWDLEAPGLERYYYPGGALQKIVDKPGLIDMLLRYKQEMSQEPEEGESLELESPAEYIIDIYPESSGQGKLSLLTSGRRSKSFFTDYARSVLNFDWKDFYETWEGEIYFNWLKEQFEKIADVILIDSRTGVTEMGGVCTYHLADAVVSFCSANDQCIDGTLQMVRNFSSPELTELRHNKKLITIVVPARIEKTSEIKILNSFRRKFAKEFTEYMPDVQRENENVFEQLEIPYVPLYAFEEIVAVKQTKESDYYSPELTQPYFRLSKVIANFVQIGTPAIKMSN